MSCKKPLQSKKSGKYRHPIPSREYILDILRKRVKPVSGDEITSALNIVVAEQQVALRRRLRAMERDGELIFTRRQCYALPERLDLLRGKVLGHRDGYGFLRVEGYKDDFYLSTDQMNFCVHGDVILAQPYSPDRKGRREARVVRILKPRNNQIIGRYFTNSGTSFVVPNDKSFSFNVIITNQESYTINDGVLVVVEIIQRATRRTQALGKITEILGNEMNSNLAVHISIRTHDIPYLWPEKVKKEINKIKNEIKEDITDTRIDLRHMPLITIDAEDAKDFDDAIYCKKKHKGGWRLWVAIADVSYYVRPRTSLDHEAYERGTSVYFPNKVIPMLPEILSNNLCSLNASVDRLCMVCEMTISDQGKLTSYKHYEGLMHSRASFTYNEVWSILQGNLEFREKYAPFVEDIEELYRLYQVLEIAREQRGGISFENEEPKFIFNDDHRIERIERVIRNPAHKMIEECMILANIAAARFAEKHGEPILFRDHDRPTSESITNFNTVLKELGLILAGGNNPTPIDYSNLLKKIAHRPDSEMLQTMLLRSMKQAVYDPENRGHFGLALSSYAHFTSPIRRYPDLLLHRAIKYLIIKQQKKIKGQSTSNGGYHYDMKTMLEFGQHCSMTERRAEEATRETSDWLKCDFMQDQVGQTFNGIISSVTGFGFFVRLNNLFIDGLVHVSTLLNDYYRFDPIGQRLIGSSSNLIYRLGDAVLVRVDAVHMEERKIDLRIVSNNMLCNKSNKKNRIRKKFHKIFNK